MNKKVNNFGKKNSHSFLQTGKKKGNLCKKLSLWQKLCIIGFLVSTIIAIASLFVKDKINVHSFFTLSSVENPIDSIKSLKDNIKSNILIIRKEFHPEQYSSDIDSLVDVRMIKKFQELVLEMTSIWEMTEAIPFHAESIDSGIVFQDFDILMGILNFWHDNYHTYNEVIYKINEQISEIKNFGVENKIKGYLPNPSKILYFYTLLSMRNDIIKDSNLKCKDDINKIIIKIQDLPYTSYYEYPVDFVTDGDVKDLDHFVTESNRQNTIDFERNKKVLLNLLTSYSDSIPKEKTKNLEDHFVIDIEPELKEALKYIDEIKNNKLYYKFDCYYYQFLIELNAMYQRQIADYKK